MLVESLGTLSFRNLDPAPLALGDGVTLLWGPNGAGKTNVLEALYFALAGRSCRTRADREMIAFGERVARAEAVVRDGDIRREFLAGIERDAGRRHVVDGVAVDADSAALRPAIAVFMPDRLNLVKGAPSARRAHLDGFAAALKPAQGEARRRYARALGQRNALLGRIRRTGSPDDSLDAWDAELAAGGLELMASRSTAVELLAPLFATAAAELGLGDEVAIEYRPRSRADSAEELRAELLERRGSDVARGFSSHGPHLDELALLSGGRALRRYGSQGQQRTALLALLFAERDALLSTARGAPLMLLDDVTSELDPHHRGLLCERLVAGGGQAVITATEPGHLPATCPRLEIPMRAGSAVRAVDEDSEAA